MNLLRLSQLLSDFAPFELMHYSKTVPSLSLTGTYLAVYAPLARAAAIESSLALSDAGGTVAPQVVRGSTVEAE
jgi:ABC-type Fe2+-enterobactin transport system substrate-binding protein